MQKRDGKLQEFDKLRELFYKKIQALPDKAQEFRISVQKIVDSMSEWVSSNNHVTDKQVKALKNIIKGVNKWASTKK